MGPDSIIATEAVMPRLCRKLHKCKGLHAMTLLSVTLTPRAVVGDAIRGVGVSLDFSSTLPMNC